MHNVTSAREPKACLHGCGERRGNRVTRVTRTSAREPETCLHGYGERRGNRVTTSRELHHDEKRKCDIMFFMMGITDGRKQLDFTQTVICGVCGKYGRYQVFMTYTVLSLFFIPCFKWNRHYYVQMSCCNTLYELDPEVGIVEWEER